MTTTITGKILADGQLATSKATLFTATAETYVARIIIANTTTSPIKINLYVKKSGSVSRQITPLNMVLAGDANGADCHYFPLTVILAIGDILEGVCDTITAADYLITGGERVDT